MDMNSTNIRICQSFYEQTYCCFNSIGVEITDQHPLGLRNRLNYALSYLASGIPSAIALANQIIEHCIPAVCTFSPAVSLQILLKFKPLLSAKATEFLNTYLESHLNDMQATDLDFIGVNDNFPALATFCAIVGGTLFHNKSLYRHGVKRLTQLELLLKRRGCTSEFNSPTYTPIQILAIAEIVNYAADESIVKKALWCEHRIWADIILHYHPELCQIAGPYSRSYTVDSMASIHQSIFLMYAAFGDIIKVNPMIQLFEGKPAHGDAVHGSVANMQKCAAWFASTKYHVPSELISLVSRKEFPFSVCASVETAPSTDAPGMDTGPAFPFPEYPAGEGIIKTYMTKTYGLGTATREWHNGNQTDSFHLIYKKNDSVKTQNDVGAVYMRYLVNDEKPDPTSTLLTDKGRKICMQEKDCAAAMYKPRLYNGRSKNFKGITSLKLSAIITEDCNPIIKNFSERRAAVFVPLHNIYLAFIPLHVTNLGRSSLFSVEKTNGMTLISIYNYQGKLRNFSKRSFLKIRNGVVIIVREASDYSSFSQFIKETSATKISDVLYQYELTRMSLVRHVQITVGKNVLACAYSPTSEGIQYMTLNQLPYRQCLNGKVINWHTGGE